MRPSSRATVLAALVATASLRCAPAEDPEKLFGALQSTDLEARQDAADRIDALVQKGDAQVFMRGLKSPNLEYRARSIVELARMSSPEARASLRDLLSIERRMMLPYNPVRLKPSREPADSRILVATLIARGGGDPQALPVLLRGADENQTEESLAGTCFAIGALRDPAGIAFLENASRHPETAVARAAAQALGQFQQPEAFAALTQLSKHPSAEVRSDVLSSLAARDDAATRNLLMTMGRTDESPDIRAAAFETLARFKGPDLVPYFIDRLRDAPEPLRATIVQNLSRLTGQTLGPRPDAWASWWAKHPGATR